MSAILMHSSVLPWRTARREQTEASRTARLGADASDGGRTAQLARRRHGSDVCTALATVRGILTRQAGL